MVPQQGDPGDLLSALLGDRHVIRVGARGQHGEGQHALARGQVHALQVRRQRVEDVGGAVVHQHPVGGQAGGGQLALEREGRGREIRLVQRVGQGHHDQRRAVGGAGQINGAGEQVLLRLDGVAGALGQPPRQVLAQAEFLGVEAEQRQPGAPGPHDGHAVVPGLGGEEDNGRVGAAEHLARLQIYAKSVAPGAAAQVGRLARRVDDQ